MGVFKGKNRKNLFLSTTTTRKYYKLRYSKCKLVFSSTPFSQRKSVITTPTQTPSFKRARFVSPIYKSPLYKKARLFSPASVKPARRTLFRKYEYYEPTEADNECFKNVYNENTDEVDETILYSDGESDSDRDEEVCQNSLMLDSENKSIHDTLDEVLNIFDKHNVKTEFVSFLRLVSQGKFPMDNVAFMLFIDAIKWFSSDDVRAVRYSDTTLRFFCLGKKLFGGRFLRFMSGPKNETDKLLGKNKYLPSNSKVKFACPSESILVNYNPLGYDINIEDGPGLVHQMIELVSEKSNAQLSYVLMFDGKKIKRGADMNLLGFESEPIADKRVQYEHDLKQINDAISFLHAAEDQKETNVSARKDLKAKLLDCLKIFSRYLMDLRTLRKSKQSAIAKYKEKIKKDPTLAKKFEYALDSCKTAVYRIDNCVSDLLDAQWQICKTLSFLNGVLHLFAKSKTVDLKCQSNVKLLKSVEEIKSEQMGADIPTHMIKQRSREWNEARSKFKVTGSTIYTAVGCDGLKKQNAHFDKVFGLKEEEQTPESQVRAMQYGTDCESHELATLTSVIIPCFYPNMVYFEEGYYVENHVLVSPDGSLRDASGTNIHFAFEGKAPIGNEFRTQQHYRVPDRYITQTVFEQKVMGADSGTLYLCWTPESSTVFIVPMNEQVHTLCQNIIDDTYTGPVPKRPTRLPKSIKTIKVGIKEHVSKCEFIGEFPSVSAGTIPTSCNRDTPAAHSYGDILRAFLKGKTAVKDAFDIRRHLASQVIVYLLADLDRMWKSELPHAVPVMFCYRGYSLTMEIARKLLQHCVTACQNKGLHIVAVSSDGEFIQLMVRGKNGMPLTIHQLSKDVWSSVCAMKKQDIVKALKHINRRVISITDHRGSVSLFSADGGDGIKTPKHGWTRGGKKEKHIDRPDEVNFTNSVEIEDEDVALNNQQLQVIEATEETSDVKENSRRKEGLLFPLQRFAEETDDSCEDQTTDDDDLDKTLPYNFEEILRQQTKESTETEDISAFQFEEETLTEILLILRERNSNKWTSVSIDRLKYKLTNSLSSLLNIELIDIAKYMNLKYVGKKREIKVKRALKRDLLEELSLLFGTQCKVKARKMKLRQPKRLQDLASASVLKSNYPKQVLNIVYASYIWRDKVKQWRIKSKVADNVTIQGTDETIEFQPYYVPEFDPDKNDFCVHTYDKTHLGTNLRKFICLNKLKGISVQAWKTVSHHSPTVLHPQIIEVTEEGKILDQMKEKLARNMVSEEVESEMRKHGFNNEAEFCHVVREGLYIADDVPGISAFHRCKMRLALVEWLSRDVDFGSFPPYGGRIKGMSNILYEGLRSSTEAKLYLYALANRGTYCVRAPNTLCSESFFASMQDMDPWGQGILSTEGVEKHIYPISPQ